MFFNFDGMLFTAVLHPIVAAIAQILIAISFILALLRIIKGPDVADRVVVLDLIAGMLLAYTLFHAIVQADVNFMNVSLAIAVIGFLGTVAIARYLEYRVANKEETGNVQDPGRE